MEGIKLNNRENLVTAYGIKPELFYNIEGRLVEKDGKNIRVEKSIDNKSVIYSLRLKKEIIEKVGSKVLIDKDNILSVKVEEKDKKKKDLGIEEREVIKRLALEDNEESKKAIKHLIENNISLTKENIDSFFLSKTYLEDIIEELDWETLIKLLEKGIDIGEDSLQKIKEAIEEIKKEKSQTSFFQLLGLDRELSYKEAEIIAKEIYGQTMGKDVYDSIIALHKRDMDINQENIEKLMEIMDKTYDLKNYEEENLIRALKEEVPINIENLYKLKHSYRTGNLEQNIATPFYEEVIGGNINVDYILKQLNLEGSLENINLIRGLIHYGIDVNLENYEKIIDLKGNLEEVIGLLDEDTIVHLLERDINILDTEIDQLINIIKNLEEDTITSTSKDLSSILRDIEDLKSITDRELIQLIKLGGDFKISDLKEIKKTDLNINLRDNLNAQVAEKTIKIHNIFKKLGELDRRTVSLSLGKYQTISLNNLYEAKVGLKEIGEVPGVQVSPGQVSKIQEEYLNIRAYTSLNLIKASIKEGLVLEHMPLEEVNKYIDKKINRYREIDKLAREVKYLKGREEYLIPKIMKNGLNMTLGDLRDFDSLFYKGRGLGDEINTILKKKDEVNKKPLQEGLENLEGKIKELTKSLKEGREDTREKYMEVTNTLKDLNNSFDLNDEFHGSMSRAQKYLDLQNKLKKDIVMQIPMEVEGEYKNINLIIPNGKEGINRDNILFYFNLNTSHLGNIRVNLKVAKGEISMDFFTEKGEVILENRDLLEENLKKINYSLKDIKIFR